jgi:hypothetical protein
MSDHFFRFSDGQYSAAEDLELPHIDDYEEALR